jgi:hypothetical protein
MNNKKGTIYLIQPAELVGTERYKIGCSAKNDLERCKKGYKKGTRFIDIRECDDPFAVEREIKTSFNIKFNLVAGKEYFEGNEIDIKKEFNDVVSKFTLLKCDDIESKNTSSKYDDVYNDIYFKFKSQKISLNPLLPKSKALFNPPYIDVINIEHHPLQHLKINSSILTEYEIDCRNNFNNEEQILIKKYNIKSLDDLLRCENITSADKTRSLKCYKYVCDRNELMGIEPFNGDTTIQISKYLFNIKISFDKTVKFIQSYGVRTHDDYMTIQMGI